MLDRVLEPLGFSIYLRHYVGTVIADGLRVDDFPGLHFLCLAAEFLQVLASWHKTGYFLANPGVAEEVLGKSVEVLEHEDDGQYSERKDGSPNEDSNGKPADAHEKSSHNCRSREEHLEEALQRVG